MESETMTRLVAQRVLYLSGFVEKEKVDRVRDQMLYLTTESSTEAIKLVMDTKGGFIEPALYLVDFIKFIDTPVWGIVNGECHSSGLVALQGCDLRYATLNSSVHIHSVTSTFSYNSSESDSETQSRWESNKKSTQEVFVNMLNLFSVRTGMTVDDVRELCIKGDKDKVHYSARIAKEMGLIDDIWPDETSIFSSE